MSGISRVDRGIGVALVAVLAALVGFGLSTNSHASAPAAARPQPPTSAPTPGGTAPPATLGTGTPTSAPTPVSSAGGTSGGTSTTTTVPVPPVGGPVTAVGDSIMLDIQPELTADLPGVSVDGLVSRQFEAGIAVVQADRAAGTLGNVLVVELGTNGAITPSDVDAMMQAAQGVHRVVFVNVNVPRYWAAGDNAVLAAGVARYPGLAVLADWNALSSPHPEWFTADQVHLDPAGAAALAALIARNA
ncbi:MAG TPA: hypothetical protein VND44_05955 [Acidimicrobiales bacterium]|nr:hypothetical protein [Acidimicrobiales bacterium]